MLVYINTETIVLDLVRETESLNERFCSLFDVKINVLYHYTCLIK